MRKLSLVIATIAAFCAPALFGQPTPTPTRTPTPHDGPTLDITFSGIVLFLKKPTGYRVIVPVRQAQHHFAYMHFLSHKSTTSHWDFKEFECADEVRYKRVALTADELTVVPASSIAPESFNANALKGWLPHLSDLTENNDVNYDDYDQTPPVVGKVAAQIDITRGTLRPLTLEDQYQPVKWEFRSKDNKQTLKKKLKDSDDNQFCGAAGVRWLLPIKKDIGSISIRSSLKNNPTITVPLENGQTTVVVIGNSMAEDVECPKKGPQSKDEDFEWHYKALKNQPATVWIPYRVVPKVTCIPPTSVSGNRSQRGSDCLGGQWP